MYFCFNMDNLNSPVFVNSTCLIGWFWPLVDISFSLSCHRVQTMIFLSITCKAFEASKQTVTAKHVGGHGTRMWCGSTTMASVSRTCLHFDIAHPFFWPLVVINLSLSLLCHWILNHATFENYAQGVWSIKANGNEKTCRLSWYTCDDVVQQQWHQLRELLLILLKEQGAAARPMAGLYPKDLART